VVEASNRDEVIEHLNSVGVGCGVHYPVPLSLQPAFAEYGYKKGQLPVSEKYAQRILSLAFFPEMTDAQMQTTVNEFLRVAKP
jgi:dTDP-4-amino-4,6-dideoxygalactose transaminase